MAPTGPPTEPARRPGGRTGRVRRAVLEAAVEVLARDGVTGMRYEDVAELAGVNKTTVYRNWPERADLVADALAAFSTDVAPLGDTGTIDVDLVAFVEALAASLTSPRGRALLNVLGTARDDPQLRVVLDGVFERRQEALRRRLDDATRRGELPPVDARFLADILSGPVHLRVARDATPFTRAEARRLTAVALAGVRAAGTSLRAGGDATEDGGSLDEPPSVRHH